MIVSEFLQMLEPAGEGSFEALIAELLGALTGFRFYATRSGDQGGRDGRTQSIADGSIVFECKRYGKTTLRDRELIGELAQAHIRLPELDLWIIAASREITDQNLSGLKDFGEKNAIEILALESLTDSRGTLDALVSAFPTVVQRFVDQDDWMEFASRLSVLADDPARRAQVANLRNQLLRPDAGWPSWRDRSHQEWNRLVGEEAATRSRFGQPLDVSSEGSIPRVAAEAALDNWWQNQPSKLFAMTGEEGDGKSWSVAQWLTNKARASKQFPPIVFIPSRDAGSMRSLEALVLENVRRLLPSGEWTQKLNRWLEYRRADTKEPVAVVVLDGLNERHSPDYWQTIIESSFDKPWAGKVRVICTCRSQHWEEFFAKRTSILATRFKLQSFDDNELQLALDDHGLTLSDFPDELRPLLRKPRYFDLAAEYRKQLAEAGDFTLARLYFEDWRDRCNRSNPGLSVDAFNDLLKQLAEQYRGGVQRIGKSEIQQLIGFDADSQRSLTNLTTGGVLEKDGSRWKVNKARLPMALGLLLADDLSIAKDGIELAEVIATWLEPHTGSDLEAQIAEYAVLASVAREAQPTTVAALLQAWIDTQNPRSPVGSPIERRLAAYMPQALEAYAVLARSVWSSRVDHPWAQEVLIRGFSFWSSSLPTFAARFVPVLGEWLSMVALDGPPMFRRVAELGHADKPDARVSELWSGAQANGTYEFDGYEVLVIEDDGWLRLSHAAFVIISFIKDRRSLARAFVRYSIAKAIHESTDGHKELRWAIRSSEYDLEALLLPYIQKLMTNKTRLSQWTCSRLLRAVGTESAWAMLSSIDEDALYPETDLLIESRKNPVESIFECTVNDLEEYAIRENFNPLSFIHSAKSLVSDTSLNLPKDLAKRFVQVIAQLDNKPLWQGQWRSGEDHFFEEAEIVFSRIAPKQFAEVVRRIVKTSPERSVEPLYSLSFRLEEYDLLLDDVSRRALQTARETNPAILGIPDSKGTHCEFFIFSCVLPLWTGTEQLGHVLARSPEANDWTHFEYSYKGPATGNLPSATTPRDWFRTLFYLSVLKEDRLDDSSLLAAYATGDSLVRGSLYRYMLHSTVALERCVAFISDWSWNPEMHFMEQTFGSLLLIKVAKEQKGTATWLRVDPTFRATALQELGATPQDWAEYASWFKYVIEAMQVPLSEIKVPAFEIWHDAQETGRPGRVSFVSEPARSVSLIAPETHWGGRMSEGNPFEGLTEQSEGFREKIKANNEQLRELNDRAVKLGNFWMERCFPIDAIEAMLEHAPEIVDESIRKLQERDALRVPFTAVPYYTALAEVLLLKSERADDAIGLVRALRSTGSSIRIVDKETELTYLDLDLFRATGTDVAQKLWEEELAICSTDKDLLELAIKVRMSRDGESIKWLNGIIERDLRSASAFGKARAAAIRGFVDVGPTAAWLSEPTSPDDSWYRTVLREAQSHVKDEQDARYWFHQFCTRTDPDEAWAAFRLFLTICDRRCWVWCWEEFSLVDETDPRSRFFENNRDEIRKACKENEKDLLKRYVGCEVANQMSPWRL